MIDESKNDIRVSSDSDDFLSVATLRLACLAAFTPPGAGEQSWTSGRGMPAVADRGRPTPVTVPKSPRYHSAFPTIKRRHNHKRSRDEVRVSRVRASSAHGHFKSPPLLISHHAFSMLDARAQESDDEPEESSRDTPAVAPTPRPRQRPRRRRRIRRGTAWRSRWQSTGRGAGGWRRRTTRGTGRAGCSRRRTRSGSGRITW